MGARKRTLARRLRNVLGKTPLSYFQDLRVERALHLLRTGSESIDQIATQIGYADGVTLRVLLRRKLGRGVRELRARLMTGGRRSIRRISVGCRGTCPRGHPSTTVLSGADVAP